MDIQQLRYFSAVVETGNFTRAAERCNVSQPTLSQQIINLEKELNHKLLHRLGRKAVVTEAGAVLSARAQRILSEVDNAAKELSDSQTLERTITVGAIPTLAPYLLPDLITRCHKRHPNLQVNIHENFKTTLVKEVIDGEIDLALIAMPVEDARIHAEVLLSEPLWLVVGKNHSLATQKRVTTADLAKESFVMLGTSSSLAQQVRSFFGDHHYEPKINIRCSQVATVKAFVALGAGISILPRVTQAPEDESTLAYIPLAEAEPFRDLAVIRHVLRYQSRGAEQFLAVLRDRAKELVGAAPVERP